MKGGKRAGAGRPKGSQNKATYQRLEVALQALAEGKTPLEVMLEAMRTAYDAGGAIAAMPYAKEAAPYLHPKLSSVEANIDGTLGTYEAQPIPIEERHALESSTGPAAHSDPASRN